MVKAIYTIHVVLAGDCDCCMYPAKAFFSEERAKEYETALGARFSQIEECELSE